MFSVLKLLHLELVFIRLFFSVWQSCLIRTTWSGLKRTTLNSLILLLTRWVHSLLEFYCFCSKYILLLIFQLLYVLFIYSAIENKTLSILKLLEVVFIRLFFSVWQPWLAWFDKNNLKLVNSAVKQVGPQAVKILMFLF